MTLHDANDSPEFVDSSEEIESTSSSEFTQTTDPAAVEPAKSTSQAISVDLLDESVTTELVQLFKLLSDETRLQILHILRQQVEVNVLTLCKMLNLRQPSVSHHLALLREHRLIEMRRSGKHNFYRIQPQRIAEIVNLFASPAENDSRKIALGGTLSYRLQLESS